MSSGRHSPSSDSDSAEEWAALPLPATSTVATGDRDVKKNISADLFRSLDVMDAMERELAGDQVTVVFELPGGQTYSASFFMGQSVEHLKMQLEKEKSMPYEKTTLYLGDRLLLDPLSLCDVPFSSKEENLVKVVLAA